MNNKRGQVTLFIILGIVVLIIVGLAIFLINSSKKDIPIEETYKEDYDARLAPIFNDVVFCTNTLAVEAIKKAGETGGYINVNPALYNYNLPKAYENDALELFPESGIIIPYWNHIEESPDCTVCTNTQSFPPLTGEGNSIQNSIETYIEQNLVNCLDNFSAYKYDLIISYNSLPDCKLELREDNVFVGVDWPLNVKFPDSTESTSLSKYSTTVDVRLKKMYDYALAIMYQTEMLGDSRAFEYFTKDILSIYSFGGEDAPIPPIEGPTVFEFKAPSIWLLMNVEQTLKSAVAENIPYMQVVGTKDSFMLFTNDSIENNFYSNFQNVVYFDEAFASDVRVRFNYYEIWPMYVAVGPGKKQVITPESVSMNMLLFRLTTTKYKFYYDISYPVMVTLEDDSAFGGEGFAFNYAFEVNLKHNDPYSNETIDMKTYINDDAEEETVFGYEQRTVPVKLNVFDGYTGAPLSGVTVSYRCIDEEDFVGTSKIVGGNAVIESYLAPCIGGAFFISTTDYSESLVNMDVMLDTPIVMDYIVYPPKPVTVEVRKRLFAPTSMPVFTKVEKPVEEYSAGFIYDSEEESIDRDWRLSSGDGYTSTLETDEEYIIMLNEIRSDGAQGKLIMLKSTDENKVIEIFPGTYSVEIISTIKMGEGYSRMNITIPARTFKTKGEDPIINETLLKDSLFIGGASINDETADNLKINPDDLRTKSYLVFYYPSFDPDQIMFIEDLNVLGIVQDAVVTFPLLFMPTME